MANKQVTPIKAVTKVLQHNAKLLTRVNARAGNPVNETIATAFYQALQDPERVKKFLHGLVSDDLLAI